MIIAVINETSAADRNADVLAALDGYGHTILNVGMTKNFEKPELTYIDTGFLAALLLNLGRVDYVVGGCGTGQGFFASVMQYPNVNCGLIASPMDAWLFTQINDGNCISLRLNQNYGWGSNENLKFIFEKLFEAEHGCGYPAHRQQSQRLSMQLMSKVSQITHKDLMEIIRTLPREVVEPAINYPGVISILDIDHLTNTDMADVIRSYIL